MWTVNFQMFKLDLEKAKEPEIKLPTSAGSSKKAREFQKNIYFCFFDYVKAFDSLDHNKLWKILKKDGSTRPHDLPLEKPICRSGSNSSNWTRNNRLVPDRKWVCQGCILPPWLFKLYAEYIMRNAGLEEAQAGIKITRRNINNLRYADDTTLIWQKVKRNSKASGWKWKRRVKRFA